MKKGVIGFFAVFALFTMCKKQTDDTLDYSLLYGKTYLLKIDKEAKSPDIQFPGDYLQESNYTPTNEDIRYNIAFSENGQRITIEPRAVHGKKINDDENKLQYELDEGLFAGGRFIIWISDGEFEAEYTIYGSGVPIIKSERGILN